MQRNAIANSKPSNAVRPSFFLIASVSIDRGLIKMHLFSTLLVEQSRSFVHAFFSNSAIFDDRTHFPAEEWKCIYTHRDCGQTLLCPFFWKTLFSHLFFMQTQLHNIIRSKYATCSIVFAHYTRNCISERKIGKKKERNIFRWLPFGHC